MPVTVYRQAWADAMNCKNFTESPGRWVRAHQAIPSQCLLAGGNFGCMFRVWILVHASRTSGNERCVCRARKYNADCATSILQMDLERGAGRTHRYLTDTAANVKHAFGFGLSYTTFAYSGLKAAYADGNCTVR